MTEPNVPSEPFKHNFTWLRRAAGSLIIFCCLAFASIPAHSSVATGSSQAEDDYIRASFTVEDGLPDNVVNAIVQTADGLLWVGTESGLASFDGREFTPVDLHLPGLPSQGAVNTLLEGANGDLWVGTNAAVVLIPRKALDQFDPAQISYYQLGMHGTDQVQSLYQARDGVLWAGTNHGLYRQQSGQFVLVTPASPIMRIAQALNGHLLLITDRSFVEWDGNRLITHPGLAASLGVAESEIFNVFQDQSGTMWYCTTAGIMRRGPHRSVPFKPEALARTMAFRTYQDLQGNIWVANQSGIYRAIGNRLEGPSPNVHARNFYVDRDGELWIGTNGHGLFRLKHRVVHMYTHTGGLPNDIIMAVLAAHDGKLWVGANCGLSIRDGNGFHTYADQKNGLTNTCVWSLAEDRNLDIWVGTWGGGLFRFRDGHFQQFSLDQGLVSKVVLRITVARDDSLWLATPEGISHMEGGHFRSYTVADGLSSNEVFDVFEDGSGRIWAATQGGIDLLVGEKFVPELPPEQAYHPLSIRFAQDSAGDLYTLDSPKGISRIESTGPIVANQDLKALGMVESAQHDLWFSGIDGITRIALHDLKRSLTEHDAPLDYAQFDGADGLNSLQCSVGTPNIAITPDHKLWVATVKGLAMIDLANLPQINRRAKVFVGAVTIGKDRQLAGRQLSLLPGTNHIEFHLEALDLASPEKIRLQYRMDGVDANWLDADSSRTAIYTRIPPGTHHFHVRATSSDGVWDRVGIVYEVTQRPYFYQTTWFLLVVVGSLLLLLSAAYLIRVRQIVRQTQIRLEERLVERERIARELHDTLLQGFHGLVLRLNTGIQLLPSTEPAKAMLNDALELADQVMEEGRNKVQNLRAASTDRPALADQLERVGHDLTTGTTTSVVMIAEDATRNLDPLAHDEIFAIGREAIVNAFRHANASKITVELRCDPGQLVLVCRDNGCGIGKSARAPEGHFGLLGMRERAQRLRGEITVLPAQPNGTIVTLKVPARVAYARHRHVGLRAGY
jgi:signal transduction histidine kinase/ligand-binding sensor domain-containing protein